MTKLTLVEPEVGSKNSVADPRIPTALKAIEEFLNGANIESTDNLKAGGITEASLATALIEKLTVRLGFTLEKKNESFEAVSEKYYIEEKAGATVTLPAATLNRIIGVFGAVECKVKGSGGAKLYGQFISAASEVVLAAEQNIIVLADGTNWRIIAGEAKREQKYIAKAFSAAEVEAGVEPSATRPASVTLVFTTAAQATVAVGGETALINQVYAEKSSVPLYVPPGQKWKVSFIAGSGTVNTGTILL